MSDQPLQPPLTFSRKQRIRKSREFRVCYDSVRGGDSHLLIFAASCDGPGTRVGVSVSKKHGNAVARNRKKRLLREAFRLSQHRLPPNLDLVLVPRQRSDSTLEDFCRSLVKLSRKLSRRMGDVPPKKDAAS